MKTKKYLILFIVTIAYVLVSLTIYFIQQNKINIIILPDGKNIKYDGKWSIISNDKILNRKYSLIKDGKYYLSSKFNIKDDKVYISEQQITDNMIAYRGNKVKNIDYSIEDIDTNDLSFLQNILNSNNINANLDNIFYKKKYSIDINNDEMNEYVYAISNNYNTLNGDLFSLIIIKNNDNYVIIELDKFNDEFSSYIPYLYFININKDEIGEIIIKNTYSSQIGQTTKIISFNEEVTEIKTVFEEAIK